MCVCVWGGGRGGRGGKGGGDGGGGRSVCLPVCMCMFECMGMHVMCVCLCVFLSLWNKEKAYV